MTALRHPDWHLFAEQRFRRRAAVDTLRQKFRGEGFVVLADRVTGQHLRLSARAQDLWRMLDGRRTAQSIWEEMMRRPSTAPTQTELVDWLLQLARSGLILSDRAIDARHLSSRQADKRSRNIEARAASPLGIKIPLFDPDPLVRALWPLAAPFFTRAGAAAVMVVLTLALVLALQNADALRSSADGLLSSQLGLLSLALAYPVMKTLHELAHCFAVRRFGGRVREFGIMLLLFFPVPYVEASEASAFPDRRARMLVGAVGILAELLIAALALFLWLAIEPGPERAFLWNLMLIGSVSTLLFNGNPLLKFDAYYVLADWLEMPNLAQRSGEWLADRFGARILGLRPEIAVPRDEARILTLYGTASILYRTGLTVTIALLVSQWFFVLGVVLAIWAVAMGLAWPLTRSGWKWARRARAQNASRRAGLRLVVFLVLLGGGLALVPLPFGANGAGQIAPVPEAAILPETSGRVAAVLAQDGDAVSAGDPLLRLEDEALAARRAALEARLAYLAEARARPGLAPLDALALDREAEVARAALPQARRRADALTVTAPFAGRVAWAEGRAPAPGRHLDRGAVLGHVLAPGALEAVIALPAAYAGLAQPVASVAMRLPDGAVLTRPMIRSRIVDRGGEVPAPLLAPAGGPVPEMPDRPGHALDAAWIVWVDPPGDLSDRAGQRFDARLDLGTATALEQVAFHARRLLLRVVRL